MTAPQHGSKPWSHVAYGERIRFQAAAHITIKLGRLKEESLYVRAGPSNRTICLNDFMATVAAITGGKLPDCAAEDSNNILPLLLGETVLSERSCVVNHDYRGRFAIRKGKWKLVLGEKYSLFDLEADPKESNNVAADHPQLVNELVDTLDEYKSKDRSVFR